MLSLWLWSPIHLAGFFVIAVVCHGRLARDRPPARWLTEFYLLISLGGALGGVFNAIVAPALFDSLAEYPIALVLAAICLPGRPPRFPPGPYARRLDLALPLALGAMRRAGDRADRARGGRRAAVRQDVRRRSRGGDRVNLVRRPLRFGLSLGAIVLAATLASGPDVRELHRERSFFGVYRVTAIAGRRSAPAHPWHHDARCPGLLPGRERTPLSYYHRGSPIGQLLGALPPSVTARAAIIGLGTGSIACYSKPGERWTFYEIDPAVERIARDPRLFTYLSVCAGRFDVVLGDARLRLRRRRRSGLRADHGRRVQLGRRPRPPHHPRGPRALPLEAARGRDHRLQRLQQLPGPGAGAREPRARRADGLRRSGGHQELEGHGPCHGQLDLGGDGEARARPASRRPRPPVARLPALAGTAPWTDDYSNLLGALDLSR